MARIPLPSNDDLDEQARTLLEQVEAVYGFVPNQHRLEAYLPLALRSLLNLNRRVVLAGELDPELLERIALVFAAHNGCEYCITFHRRTLEAHGVPTAEVEALQDDWREAGFTEREERAVELAVAVNDDPHAVTDSDLEALRQRGFSAQDLVQLVVFANLMRGYNAFNVVFGTDPDGAGDQVD